MGHVLYFTADWCNPCKKVRPFVEEINRDGLAKIQIIDADDNEELCRKFEIRSIPTFIVIENGEEVRRVSGAPPSRVDLLNFIEGQNGSN